MTRRVLVVASNFPTARFPERGVFVLNAAHEMARQDAQVDVIAPASWIASLRYVFNRPVPVDFEPLRVRQPFITALPLRLWRNVEALTAFNDSRLAAAVRRSMRYGVDYTFHYAHFLPAGRALLAALGPQRRGPVILNLGESDPWDYDRYYGDSWARDLARFDGVLTVSTRNYHYLLRRQPTLATRLMHLPNGVDTARFRPLDRDQCRDSLGLPRAATIAAFCGHFDHRKGPLRTLAALRRLGIQGVFLGSNGPDRPVGDDVLFAGSVRNADLPQWYGASDVFVLPSLSEGMSNAMLEAVACGLPLVVGDLDFNRFLNEQCARFVDPMDPAAIAAGIAYCLQPDNNVAMRRASLQLAAALSIKRRVQRIFEFALRLAQPTGSPLLESA